MKHTLLISAAVYGAAWANINVKFNGIHPIGTQAVYIAGETCTINLEEDSNELFCSISMPLYTPSHELISTLNECLEENGLTVEEAGAWVVPAHQQCLRLHDQWRRERRGGE